MTPPPQLKTRQGLFFLSGAQTLGPLASHREPPYRRGACHSAAGPPPSNPTCCPLPPRGVFGASCGSLRLLQLSHVQVRTRVSRARLPLPRVLHSSVPHMPVIPPGRTCVPPGLASGGPDPPLRMHSCIPPSVAQHGPRSGLQWCRAPCCAWGAGAEGASRGLPGCRTPSRIHIDPATVSPHDVGPRVLPWVRTPCVPSGHRGGLQGGRPVQILDPGLFKF